MKLKGWSSYTQASGNIAWKLDLADVATILVHRHVSFDNDWLVTCRELNIVHRKLGVSGDNDSDVARELAVDVVSSRIDIEFQRLKKLSESLGRNRFDFWLQHGLSFDIWRKG